MTIFTTGIIKNPLVSGQRQMVNLAIRFRNAGLLPLVVQIRGYYWQGNERIEYVMDSLTLAPGVVKDTQHYAQFEAVEFRFVANEDLKLRVWGKNATGTMTAVYPVQIAESTYSGQLQEQEKKALENRLYTVNPSSNTLDVFDKRSRAPITSIAVGINPQGVDYNPMTGRIYVSNMGSNTVTVIDGVTNTVIATVLVGKSPGEVRVDVKTNRVYITRAGSVPTISSLKENLPNRWS